MIWAIDNMLIQVIVQCLLACLLCGYGIVKVSGDFKNIDSAAELNNKWENSASVLLNNQQRVAFSVGPLKV